MNNLVKKYLLHLQYERGLSSNTINSYSLDLNKYVSYLKEKFSIIEPNEIYMKHIKSFTNDELQYIVNNKSKKSEGYQYSSTTISRYFSSIRGFHSFLLSEGMCKNDPSIYLDKPKVNKKIPNYLEFNDIKKILNSVDLESKFGLRDNAILLVLYSCGLRATELLELKLINLMFDDEFIRLIGKGKKERFVPISIEAISAVNKYLEYLRPNLSRRNESLGFLFLSNRGKKLSRMSLWKIVRKYSKRACINTHVSPHTFRHSFASHLVHSGANLRVVQEMLGHSDISSTQIYTHLNKTELKKVYDKFHPVL